VGIDLRNAGASQGREYSGAKRLTRVLYIENVLPEQIEWAQDGMPDRAEKHPDPKHATALSRAFNAVRHGDSGGSRVTIEYRSAEIRHAGEPMPEPETLTSHALLWQMSFREVAVPFPTGIIEPQTQPVTWGGVGTFLVARKWIWEWDTTPEVRPVLRVKWKLSSPDMSDADELASQANRLHQLPEVSARWERDDGTPLMMNPPSTNFGPILPGNMSYLSGHEPAEGLTRDPYKELKIQHDKDSGIPLEPNQPLMSQKVVYPFDTRPGAGVLSWQQLPQFPGFG
jgi:hypothetical protein